MSAIDECEPQVIRAFEKDGWQVREKPFFIPTPQGYLRADVSFENPINSQEIVVVEVKCFTDPKQDLNEFYRAVGQYQTYRNALRLNESDLPLWLTIPLVVYRRFQQRPELMLTLQYKAIQHVIIDLTLEEIVTWKT